MEPKTKKKVSTKSEQLKFKDLTTQNVKIGKKLFDNNQLVPESTINSSIASNNAGLTTQQQSMFC